ncbi:MAG: hypothetical protein JWQ40_1652 [Segetibacter sp.]|nr:hypothetical protein [Segetibacter sp.]
MLRLLMKQGMVFLYPRQNEIRNNHKYFKDKIKRNNKIAAGLKDFSLTVKMEKEGLKRIRKATTCKYYLFCPAIDYDYGDNLTG